jgi:hypothetical protein
VSDRIIALDSLPDIDPLPLDEDRPTKVAERRALALFARSAEKVTRNWRDEPLDMERVRRMASLVRREFGDLALSRLERYPMDESHFGVGVPLVELRAEVRMQHDLGIKPEPRPSKMRWTNKEVFAS